MNQRNQDVTEAELALLQALWDEGPATIRQLVERVYQQTGTSVYATVQKLLDRLEAKGCVERDRGGPVHVFRAAINRDELIGRRLRAVADSLCGGSLSPLLTHLVEGRGLSEKERRELRALVEKLDRKQRLSSQRKGSAVETLYRAGLSNAVSATVLAVVVACLGRVLGRRPAVLHCLWLLVLLKLVTPPLYEVSDSLARAARARLTRAHRRPQLVLSSASQSVGPAIPTTSSDDRSLSSPDLPVGRTARSQPRSWLGDWSSDRLDATGLPDLDRRDRDDAGRLDRANPPVSASACAKLDRPTTTRRTGSTSWPRAWAWIARRRSGGSTASSRPWSGPWAGGPG